MSVLVRFRALVALACLLAAISVAHAAGELIPRSVVGSGATGATGNGLLLRGTLAQPAVGTSQSATLIARHGFWSYAAAAVLAVDSSVGPPSSLEFSASPNPSRGALTFDLGLPRAAAVELSILDVQGRAVVPRASRVLAAGRHRLAFDRSSDTALGPGIYFARLVVDGKPATTRRFVRVR